MTTPVKPSGMSEGRDRVGGTYGGGRRGEPTSLSEVLSGVLLLVGSDPLRGGTREALTHKQKVRASLSQDPDLAFLVDKTGLHPSLVGWMTRYYGRPVVIEAMRCMVGRPQTHPGYFASVCRRIAEGRP